MLTLLTTFTSIAIAVPAPHYLQSEDAKRLQHDKEAPSLYNDHQARPCRCPGPSLPSALPPSLDPNPPPPTPSLHQNRAPAAQPLRSAVLDALRPRHGPLPDGLPPDGLPPDARCCRRPASLADPGDPTEERCRAAAPPPREHPTPGQNILPSAKSPTLGGKHPALGQTS